MYWRNAKQKAQKAGFDCTYTVKMVNTESYEIALIIDFE